MFRVTRRVADGYPKHHGEKQESDACRLRRESGVSPNLDPREGLGDTKRRAAAYPSDVEKT